MFEIRSEWSIEASRKTFRRENPSGTIGGETPFATYLTVPRKPTSSLITQRNLPTFSRNPRKETKAKIEGARKEQRFLSPFPTSPKNRFFHFFSSYFLSHIYIYIFLPFWRRYFYIFTSVRRTFIDRRGRRADSSQNHSLAQVPTPVPPLVWMSRLAIRRGKGRGGENGEFRGGRFLSMLITVAGVNHDRPGARSAKWVRAGWPSPNRHGPAG